MNYDKIKEYCDDRRISLPELATKIGLTKSGLYLAISKKTLTVEKLEKISTELNVPIWYFFDLDPEKPYINDIEREKNRNKINEETLEQMTKVIAELKRKLDNISAVAMLFQLGREFYIYEKLSNEAYAMLINILNDFLNSDHDYNAHQIFVSKFKFIAPFRNNQ